MITSTNEIWNDFSSALRKFILKRVQDDTAADDILQEVFTKVIKNIKKLREKTKLQAWLYQITRNTIIDYYRHKKADFSPSAMPEYNADQPEKNSRIAQDLAPCIQALMSRMPARYKSAIELTEFQGLTQKEMSKKLDLSLSGAKSRAQRARKKMQDLLLECCSFEIDRRGNILDYQPQSETSPECCKKQSNCPDDDNSG